MVKRLTLENEVIKILECIDEGNNFLLSGGAGSGKTYSLVQVINQLLEEQDFINIACVTYTNAAADEIDERVLDDRLHVSTIHEFLWSTIKNYQKEIKLAIVDLVNREKPEIRYYGDEKLTYEYLDNIEDGILYKEFFKIREGIVSHDEIIKIANYMYEKYPLLSKILKDKFQYVFIDEYQDTDEKVIQIFLDYINKSKGKIVIGLFGDSMQSIYRTGVGDVKEYIGNGSNNTLIEIQKTQNRRCPQVVIDLANKLRTDSLEQRPSEDIDAPNMENGRVILGSAKFYYSNNQDINFIKKKIGWNFEDVKETKILNLTHNLIAPNAGFENLMDVYNNDKILDYRNRLKKYIKKCEIEEDFSGNTFGEVIEYLEGIDDSNKVRPTNGMKDYIESNREAFEFAKTQDYLSFSKLYINKDQLLDGKKDYSDQDNKKKSKRDSLINHLFKIKSNIELYKNKEYNEFIRVTNYNIDSIQDKVKLKESIEKISSEMDITIEEAIEKADNLGICIKDDKVEEFIKNKEYVYYRLKNIKFSEFTNLYNYLEGYTPFSTQHKTKGTEYDNVLVILNNGGWNSYNFKKYFEKSNSESVQERTSKILYVCCTRTKRNLAVFFNNPSSLIIRNVKLIFGIENVINLDERQ